MGAHASKEQVTIDVANDQKVHLMSAMVEIDLESVDGNVDSTIVVKTSDKICGGMQPKDWVQINFIGIISRIFHSQTSPQKK